MAAMGQFKRSERVSGLVHRTLSTIIEHNLWDQRVKNVTVTGVEVSRDLKHAHVYVSVLGDDSETEAAIKALNGARNFLRSRLGEEIRLRYTPELHFRYDSSIVDGMRMDKLLAELNGNS